MGYFSTSILKNTVTFSQVEEIIDLLRYKRIRDKSKIENLIAGYYWYDETDYRSWSGVDLEIYKEADGSIKVTTQSNISHSYWDITHQNKTLKLLRDLFGGNFDTDAGRNRYWRPQEPPPTPMSSGCYLARWRFHKNFTKAKVYLMYRKMDGSLARDSSSGFEVIDGINPRLLSNNLLVPFMIAAWEEFFRSTFAACLRYSKQREIVLKRANLRPTDLEKFIVGSVQPERIVAERFSFQRPSSISDAFKLIDSKLDLASPMRKPYRRRRTTLYDSLEALVENRNVLVHAGKLNLNFFDKLLENTMNDLIIAVNRSYDYIADHYSFVPNHNY